MCESRFATLLQKGHSRPPFLYFRLSTVNSKHMFYVNISNEWIRTVDK